MLREKLSFRHRIERRIVRKVITTAIADGYSLNVDNGGEVLELPNFTRNFKEVFNAMFAADEDVLILKKDGRTTSFVRFIYGNSGWDVVNDYGTSLKFMDEINTYCDHLGEIYED